MTGRRALLLSTVLAVCLAQAEPLAGQATDPQGAAQDPPVALIADRVELTGDGRLVATGRVQAIQGERRLTASQIAYDPETERLDISGPITLVEADGSVLVADAASLDTGFRDGLLSSARLVLDRELQLAATEITRVDGRYTQLTKTVASSCEVCDRNPVPLWQIRAESVIHDELERQLYFRNAWFDLFGVPVFWVPRLRLPDPTLERATGFLTPSIRTTDELGFGIKLPYFIRLGDHRDVTLTPYLSDNRTHTLELRYREAFTSGGIEVNAAVSDDDIEDDLRGYLFAAGAFDLPRDYRLAFDVELTSDEAYLLDYDYSDKDRLDSAISITRTSRDRFLGAEVIAYRSLRASEDNDTQPFLVGDATWIRKFAPPGLGGTAQVELQAHGHERTSQEDVIGRDVGRLTVLADWRRSWTGTPGIILETRGQVRLDHTVVSNDTNFDDRITDLTPSAAVTLRWPWLRVDPDGVRQVIEPTFQVAWSPRDSQTGPVDESTQLEFDEGNLFSLSRFPAGDILERGLRGNLGVTYTRVAPGGVSVVATLGRIFRADGIDQFDGYDILSGSESNWLTSLVLDFGPDVSLASRALFDDDYNPTRNDLRFSWQNDVVDLAGTWTWLRANTVEMRSEDTNEWRLDGAWQIDSNWRADADWRYDLKLDRSASAKIGLQYRTECARFDLGVRRRFTSSEQIRPTTDVNFEVSLEGFGNRSGGPTRKARSACRS